MDAATLRKKLAAAIKRGEARSVLEDASKREAGAAPMETRDAS